MGIFDSIMGLDPSKGFAPDTGLTPEVIAAIQAQQGVAPGISPQPRPQPQQQAPQPRPQLPAFASGQQPSAWFGVPNAQAPSGMPAMNTATTGTPQVQPQAPAPAAPQAAAPARPAPGTTASGYRWDPLAGWVDAKGHSSAPTAIQTALGLPGSSSNPAHPGANAPVYGAPASAHPITDGAHKRGFLAGLLAGIGGSLSGGGTPAAQAPPAGLSGSVQVAPQAANTPTPPTRPTDI